MSAVLPIARDGHLRRNSLVNLESTFARTKGISKSLQLSVFYSSVFFLFFFFFSDNEFLLSSSGGKK